MWNCLSTNTIQQSRYLYPLKTTHYLNFMKRALLKTRTNKKTSHISDVVVNSEWKWISIVFMVLGAVPLSFNLPIIPFSLAFVFFLLGHGSMAYLMHLQRERSLALVNVFWCLIDVVGIIRWI